MSYLVDANVLSEPTKPAPQLAVVDWLRRHERDLVVDPFIVGEIRFGILLLPRGARRSKLEAWFESGIGRLRCVSWEAREGRRWAELLARLRARGQAMPIKDSLIASTALAHDLTIVTRNRVDFAKAGVRILDPFAA